MALEQESLINRRFGRLLARERKKKHKSQEALAAAVGLSRTSVTNIERGRQPVQLYTLYQLAKELDVEPQDLLPAVPNIRATVPMDGEEINRLNVREVDWLRKITRFDRQGDKDADYRTRHDSGKRRDLVKGKQGSSASSSR